MSARAPEPRRRTMAQGRLRERAVGDASRHESAGGGQLFTDYACCMVDWSGECASGNCIAASRREHGCAYRISKPLSLRKARGNSPLPRGWGFAAHHPTSGCLVSRICEYVPHALSDIYIHGTGPRLARGRWSSRVTMHGCLLYRGSRITHELDGHARCLLRTTSSAQGRTRWRLRSFVHRQSLTL